jgi:WW domain
MGWREVRTPEGKVYYYDVKTKETSWTMPDGVSSFFLLLSP